MPIAPSQVRIGPGILLFQEIFGINDNIGEVADRLAGAGFVTLASDMFWRIERRFERKDESGLGDAFAMVQKLDLEKAADDIRATHAHLVGMPECTGKVGAVGILLRWSAGVHGGHPEPGRRARDSTQLFATTGPPSTTCSNMSAASNVRACTTTARIDAFIPLDKIDEVETALRDCPGVEFHRYAAGHTFSNWDAPSMYNEAAADEAWTRTLGFFANHLW